VRQHWEASKSTPFQKHLLLPLSILTYILFVLFFLISEVLFSTVFDIARLYIVLIWGTSWLKYLKEDAPRQGITGSENEWGFGQILPLLLLALPFFAIMEIYHGMLLKYES